MLKIGEAPLRTCAGISRRELLQVGGLGLLGIGLADTVAGLTAEPAAKARREKSCIVLWLDGGPSHFETFDPKPDTPDNVRGPYGAIKTSVSGVLFSELMPMTAQHMHRCALIRSLSHRTDAHAPIPMLTGANGTTTSYGAVIARLKGPVGEMPPYVHLGSRLGVGGGKLGSAFDPVVVRDPTGSKLSLPQFSLRADVSPDRFTDRRSLLGAIDRMRGQAAVDRTLDQMDNAYRRAIDMLTSAKVRTAFDLNNEKDPLRERYGMSFFGQSCLLARRLVEVGTRFVQIKWYEGPAWDAWDVHGADLGGMVRMEQSLCPRLDQGLSALIEDLHQRGLLASTLIVVMGEFGRTPRINAYGARDHWPYCFSVLLAGGGVPGGVVVGASDREGAYPAHNAVSPAELAATLYRLLGIDTNTDPRIRPFIGAALPVGALV
jgi:hypothetical protein